LSIAAAGLPNGSVGAWYSQSLTASGGLAPYSWSITSGVLPTGLSLATATGAISGIATAAGQYGFAVQVADAQQSKAVRNVSIYVPFPGCLGTPVRISGQLPASYPDFASAYAQVLDGDTIELQTLDFGGDLVFNRNVRTALVGGYDCGFLTDGSAASLLGALRVSDGVVNIDKLRFR
jgi:hypothetical protein